MCGVPGQLTAKDPAALRASLRSQGIEVPDETMPGGGTASSRTAYRPTGTTTSATTGGATQPRVLLAGGDTGQTTKKTLLGA